MRTEWHGVEVQDFSDESLASARDKLQQEIAPLGGTIKQLHCIGMQRVTGEKIKRVDAECEFQ